MTTMSTAGHEQRRGAASIWRGAAALLGALALSGCATSVVPPSGAGTTPRYTPATRPPAVTFTQSYGVIGVDARDLVKQFGDPRLDIRDPSVRKLQFANGRCVLDTYLYSPQERREPVVTFAEARTPDGSSMDWMACVDQLRRK